MSTRQTAATLSTAVTAFEQAIAAGALIAATESLEIGNDVVVQGAGVVSNTGAHTLIGVAASVGDVFSTGTVDIRNGASVRGQVYTGAAALTGPGHATAVTNWVGSKVSLQLLEPVSGQVGPRIAPEPGSNNVAVTLQPGRYQGLYLKAGTKAILESGGVYEFGEVILDSGSKVEVDSTCGSPTLQVVSTTIFRGEIIDSSPTPSGVSLVHRGSQTVHIETPFVGSIVAPKAELILNSSTHKGQFVAKKLRIQANAVIVPMANSIGVACASTVPVQGEQRSCSEGVCCHERAPMTPTGALVQGCTMSEVGRCIVLGSQSDVLASDVSVQVLGSGGDDRLLGSAEADMLAGGQGDDSECAGGGNDSLFGGSGNDMLRGGAGDDFIAPGPGSDIVIAGDGNDTVALLDACEAASGSIIDFGTGSNVLLSPISPDELRASGVTLSGEFEWREVGDGCLSPCSGRPVCTTGQECEDRRATGGGLVCVDPLAAPKPGQSVEPWVGSDGDIRARLQAWEEAAASFGPGAIERYATAVRALRTVANETVQAIAQELQRDSLTQSREARVLTLLAELDHVAAQGLLLQTAMRQPVGGPLEKDSPAETDQMLRSLAVSGLMRHSMLGFAGADDALLQVADQAEDRALRIAAAVAFLRAGNEQARRDRLAAVGGADVSYALSVEFVDSLPHPPRP